MSISARFQNEESGCSVNLAIVPKWRTVKHSASSGAAGPILERDPAKLSRSPVRGRGSSVKRFLGPGCHSPRVAVSVCIPGSGRLNRCMAEQELNLFKFSPSQLTESCAGAA